MDYEELNENLEELLNALKNLKGVLVDVNDSAEEVIKDLMKVV